LADLPPYVSHSALAQFLRCSEQYRLERIEKVPTPPAWYLLGGSAAHLATERMDLRDEYPYSDNQLEHLWSEAFDQEVNEAFQAWPEDGEWLAVGRRGAEQGYAYWGARGLAAVKAWQDWRLDPERTLLLESVEEEILVPLPSGVTLKGYIDRVFKDPDTGEYHVCDIKSGTKRPDSGLQLGFYKIGYEAKYPGRLVTSASWWMAKDSQDFPVPVDHFTVELIDKWVQAYYRGVANEVFIPNVSGACFHCSLKAACSAYPKG